jgi:hypothetical protein
MVDKVVTERSGPEEVESKGANLSKYIVDPELDGVNIDKDRDDQPTLEEVPTEFKEPDGEAKTPKEVLTPEEDEKKRLKAKEIIQKKLKVEADKKVKADVDKKKVKVGAAIVPEVIEESKEDQADRYKEILINLGFRLKEGTEEGKAQYVLKFGDLSLGRTFQAAYPNGKFWARKDDKFLEPADVKEIGIVKEFYLIRDGKKEITEVVQQTERVKNLEPTNKSREIRRQEGSMKLEKKGIYYMVGGHKEPDAALVQQWANELGVSLRVMVAEQDDTSAKAVVRAEKNGQFIESVVIHYFKTSRDVIALEIIEGMQRRHQNPIEGYREDGRPVLSQETNYRIYKRVIRFMNFAIRDAITKAARIAALKILNRDWREPEEIASEAAEVRSVNAE